MNRFEYLKDKYSVKWITARKEYGITGHEKYMISLVKDFCPKGLLLDVGIGTGEPFAERFIKDGYDVEGVDIAENLLEICRSKGIKASFGNAEQKLDYGDNCFDLVYCFNSTWYFKNIEKAIAEMIRVSKKWVIFDIIDATGWKVKLNQLIYRLKHLFRPKYEFPVHPGRIRKMGSFREYKKEKLIFVYEKK
jgi:ubiquinone/menaquinone biosynthesis C-methylase UbiE